MRNFRIKLILALLAALPAVSFDLCGQEVSAEAVMAKVLLDSSAGTDIKRENIHVLMTSETGCVRLAEILNSSENYYDVRKLICDSISSYSPGGLFAGGNSMPEFLVEPLLKCLYSDNQPLSSSAGSALAICFPETVLPRLAGTAMSEDINLSLRLAAIGGIEKISGREAILDLAELMKSENQDIRENAISAVCRRLVIDRSTFDVAKFVETELPNLRWMSDVEFLQYQGRRLAQSNNELAVKLDKSAEQALYWQTKYLRSETDRFNSLTPENKLVMLESRLDAKQDKPVRNWAAEQLQTWGNTAAAREGAVAEGVINILGKYISDPEASIRSSVASALGVFGNKPNTAELIQKLLEQLKVEQSPACQKAILDTLGQLQYGPALEECIDIWETSHEPDIASAAISTAGKIASKLLATESGRVDTLINSICNNVGKSNDIPQLKVAVYQAIRKILEIETWRAASSGKFAGLIQAGLKDGQADVRSMAVYGYAAASDKGAVKKLLEMGLLDDPEATVRFAVISAVDSAGSPDCLDYLKNRFLTEKSNDVKGRLQEAIMRILRQVPVDAVYSWVIGFDSNNENLMLLKSQTVSILVDKVTVMKSGGQEVDPKYERFILEYNIDDYTRKAQFDQAGRSIVDLLNYGVDISERIAVYDKLFGILFNSDVDIKVRRGIIDMAEVTVVRDIRTQPELQSKIQSDLGSFDMARPDSLQLSVYAYRKIISPLEAELTGDHAEFWKQQKKKLIDSFIDEISAGKIACDDDNIELLKKLDIRFANFPENGGLDDFKKCLNQETPKY